MTKIGIGTQVTSSYSNTAGTVIAIDATHRDGPVRIRWANGRETHTTAATAARMISE